MDENVYKITLADGTVLNNLRLNGNNYISTDIIDDSVFEGNLGTVIISDGKTIETYEDMTLIQNTVHDGQSWFVLTPDSSHGVADLEELIAYKIQKTKEKLEEYLAAHPVTSSAHGSPAQYSVTAEKQALLTSSMVMAQGALSAGIPYGVTWNATGQVCEAWELSQLQQLAFEMAAYVKPLVTYQHSLETELRACTTLANARSVRIDYSSVHGINS